jgi:putative (di)nucleoside polyphosphate hydrolase
MALRELARFLPRSDHRNRYLRAGMRSRDGEPAHEGMQGQLPSPVMELPPGATFEPNPQGQARPPEVLAKGKHAT